MKVPDPVPCVLIEEGFGRTDINQVLGAVNGWEGYYLYGFNSSEENWAPLNQTALMLGLTLTEFDETSTRRPDWSTTQGTTR